MAALDGRPRAEQITPCSVRLAALWLIGRRRRYRIAGPSMEPSLREGQSVLLNPRAYASTLPAPGEVVLLRHPTEPDLIAVKRLAYVERDGAYVLGDNPVASTDSRNYGLVPLSHLLGRIECTFP